MLTSTPHWMVVYRHLQLTTMSPWIGFRNVYSWGQKGLSLPYRTLYNQFLSIVLYFLYVGLWSSIHRPKSFRSVIVTVNSSPFMVTLHVAAYCTSMLNSIVLSWVVWLLWTFKLCTPTERKIFSSGSNYVMLSQLQLDCLFFVLVLCCYHRLGPP